MTPVEDYILNQPEILKPVIKKLRFLILSASPRIEEKIVYGLPFFYGKKRIFYINVKRDFVELGFCRGYLMAEHPGLEIQNRTQVKTITFNSLPAIKDKTILPLIHEAILIDEQH